MKKSVLYIFIFIMVLALLCACDNSISHVHTFENFWTYDTDNHWHASTCEHKDEKANLASHSFNKEYVCSVCGYKEEAPYGTDALSEEFKKEGNNFTYSVSAQTSFITLSDKFSINAKATSSFSKQLDGSSEIVNGVLPLEYGDNVCYMTVTHGKDISVYSISIHRNIMCTVSFESDGGLPVENLKVEEGTIIEAPVTTKEGYKFDGWDFDFSQPVTTDLVIKAKWTPLGNIQYTVEIYLEDINGEYKIAESFVLYGLTDSDAQIPQNNYAHYSLECIEGDKKIIADGSSVIKIMYSRDQYKVVFNTQGGTLISGNLEQNIKYEMSATAPVLEKAGFDFAGFDKAFNNVSSNLEVNAVWNSKDKLNYDTSSIQFPNSTVIYDGSLHYIDVTGLPEGVSVSYENNGQKEVGSYTVTASFLGDYDNYNVIPSITATLEIQKATYDMTSVSFENKTVVYDGNTHSLVAKNIPEGVKVSYQNNDQVDSGKYVVTASFEGDYTHFNKIPDCFATLTINKADIDISKVVFNDLIVEYDGKPHSIVVSNLPNGVNAQYNIAPSTDAGTYIYEAILIPTNPNYNSVQGLSATLVIKKARINTENIIFNSTKVKYDGKKHSVTLQNLPEEIKPENIVYYYNGDAVDGVSAAGTYSVIASFQLGSNYVTPPNLQATLEIERDNYIDKYKAYPELGKTIDLINSSDFKVKTGTKSVFSDELYYYPVDEFFIGNESGTPYYASSASNLISDFHASINAKISFGPRENKNGAFLTNKLPRIDFENTGAYQKKSKKETKELHYIYQFLKEGLEVSINGFNSAEDLTPILSDDLINDALKVRNGVYSAADFVERWGTHVIMAAKYGARVDVNYDVLSTSDEDYQEWSTNISLELEKRFLKTSINTSVDVGASKLDTSTSSQEIKRLSIRSKSKNVVGLITSIEEMPKFFETWSNKYNPETDNIFIDVPDKSLYCIWHLLGPEFNDIKAILDEYVISECKTLNDDYLSRINNLKTNDDIFYSSDEKTLYINVDNIQEPDKNVSIIDSEFGRNDSDFFEGNTLIIYPSFNFQSIDRIVITGKYGLIDSKGREISSQIEDFSLKLDSNWNRDIEIVIRNLNVKSVEGIPVFDFNSNHCNVLFVVDGKNNIEAASSSSPAIISNNLSISSDDPSSKVSIQGYSGKENQDGGCAIICDIFTASDIRGLIRGGDGGNGIKSNSLTSHGSNGGNGSSALIANRIVLDNTSLRFVAGNGGAGGDGYDGENGYAAWKTGGNPREAESGTNGGNGGSGAKAIDSSSVYGLSLNDEIINGNGGNGGKGGDGGDGGIKDGEKKLIVDTSQWGGINSGNAGNGGNGGDGYGFAGNGGKAGLPGAVGYIYNHSWSPAGQDTFYGISGSEGTDGKPGIIIK